MNATTGNIHVLTEEEGTRNYAEFRRVLAEKWEEIERQNKPLIPIEEKYRDELECMSKSARKNWMRNKPCPCESGKKFKRCCWNKFK